MQKKKQIIFLIAFFLLYLIWGLLVVDLYADEVWNYGFSYSIYKGLIPYKDFNMVLTPFYPFLNAIFFKIFGMNMLVFHIVNSLILTTMSYILYKLIGKNVLFALLFLFLPLPNIFPSYNLFVVFLFVLLLYLEEKKQNDILIGIVIGLSILTKQSVGVCLLLPSLYYIKDIKKLLKRIVGIIIPNIIFLIYLLISKSLMEFIDLCILGLFDFTKNKSTFNLIYIFSIIYLVVCIYMIYKNKKNINNYYALAIFSMTLPLVDLYHFQMSFFGLLIIIFMNYKVNLKLNITLLFIGILLGTGFKQVYDKSASGLIYPNNIKNFEHRLISKDMIEYTNELNDYLDKHKDRNVVYLTNNAYFMKISRNEIINSLDLINYGNHGYNGNEKLLKLIKENKDSLFVVEKSELDPKKQTNKNIIKYVIKNAKKVDKKCGHDIYIFNGDYVK